MKLKFPLQRVSTSEEQGSWFPFGVGIDCHKEMIWVCVLKADYKRHSQEKILSKFGTTPLQLLACKKWLESMVPSDHRRYLIESTGTFHFPVLWALQGWEATVFNPQLLGGSKRKTDRWDANKLAQHSMAGTFPCYPRLSWEELAARALFRRWWKMRGNLRREWNGILSRLTLFGLNASVSTKTKEGRRFYEELGNGVAFEDLSGRASFLGRLSEFSGAYRRIPEVIRWSIRSQLDSIRGLESTMGELWKRLLCSLPSGQLDLLQSVPHVGSVVGTCFLAEIGFDPLLRFSSVGGVVAFSGFDPSKRISADKITSHVPVGGSRYLRRIFVEAANGAMLGKGGFGLYGQSVAARRRKKGWSAGVWAIGRKMVRACAAVLAFQKPYEIVKEDQDEYQRNQKNFASGEKDRKNLGGRKRTNSRDRKAAAFFRRRPFPKSDSKNSK